MSRYYYVSLLLERRQQIHLLIQQHILSGLQQTARKILVCIKVVSSKLIILATENICSLKQMDSREKQISGTDMTCVDRTVFVLLVQMIYYLSVIFKEVCDLFCCVQKLLMVTYYARCTFSWLFNINMCPRCVQRSPKY